MAGLFMANTVHSCQTQKDVVEKRIQRILDYYVFFEKSERIRALLSGSAHWRRPNREEGAFVGAQQQLEKKGESNSSESAFPYLPMQRWSEFSFSRKRRPTMMKLSHFFLSSFCQPDLFMDTLEKLHKSIGTKVYGLKVVLLRNQVTVNGVCELSSSDVKHLLSNNTRAKVCSVGFEDGVNTVIDTEYKEKSGDYGKQ
ncbi:hypothetical protein MRB53_009457 [Persea americana]|uniref:Uncharacterized protein n=1 Tax=Persea americana TaxID=3435 RepID=A0ACC2LP23_PERAE|nr:hypothetical protein MRB53_009457 [Persea americana]